MSTERSDNPSASLAPGSDSSLRNSESSFSDKDVIHVEMAVVDAIDSNSATEAPSQVEENDNNLVYWDGPNDPENPLNWEITRKWVTIGLISLSSFNVSMVSTIFAPGVPDVLADFHTHSPAIASFTVSVYVMGSAIGPLVLTPITEMSGRLPMTHTANILFTVAATVCATSVNMSMLIISRLVMGMASAVPCTVGGGFIGDLFPMERRGTAMTIWTVGPLLGMVTGPIYGGFMVQNIGWRWTIWLEAILGSVIVFVSLIFLRETYAPTLLHRKAMRLEMETGRKFRTKYESELTTSQLVWASLSRPLKLLFLSPIVFIVSFYSAVAYSYIYVLITTFTDVFEGVYGFTPGEAGLGYLGLGLGFCVGQISIGYYSDRHLKQQEEIHGRMKPEDRLPPLLVGCCLVPVGLFWYGWSAEYQLHWIIPIIGTFFLGLGLFLVQLVTQVYLVDSYTLYAASAFSVEMAIRCIFGATIPLGGTPLYNTLGLGWGNTVLGFIALALAPTSIFLLKYGERIRTNPRFQPRMI